MQDFRKLDVWKQSHDLVLEVYRSTADFPGYERFGLSQQLRRCSVSIPSNIAEGASRPTDRDFARFVAMAIASASEAEYQLLLAHDLGYVGGDRHELLSNAVVSIRRMLITLHRRLAHSS
ncbi:MAG: four helix bundle protein [Acidimicrobiia bacterium]|nr:four helix bundle protein [Acidimicrobiia bacterium]NNF87348.1 four helix bundle protein [Acidimicrobiia bacterium]NNJ46335.1 four helix bundle protein [Acidimicrobiia bacterium]NNL96914.1 four helix bundle protein [Acidimicrobiia bacterium]RZV47822.1 MAG: four helix bundle protein [Acidimicrobiia bacterium]